MPSGLVHPDGQMFETGHEKVSLGELVIEVVGSIAEDVKM
jgi:hypothetical protein